MKHAFLVVIFFLLLSSRGLAAPSGTIESSGPVTFCESGIAKIKIKFVGAAPFGYSLIVKNTKTGDLVSYSTKLNIQTTDLINGYYEFPGNLSVGLTYTLTEVFDQTNWPSDPVNYIYNGTPIGSTDVSGSAVFNVDTMPEVNAGLNQDLCGYQAQLSATPNFTTSQIYWNAAPIGSTISDVNIANPLFQASTEGVFTLIVNEKNGACVDQDEVEIKLKGSPTANLSGTSNICGTGSINASITLTGNGPWAFKVTNLSTSNDVSFTNVTTSPYSFTLPATGNQTYSIKETRDKNNCVAFAADIKGTANSIDITPSVNAGLDQIICGTYGATLSGTSSVTTGSILWTSNSPSTISSPSSLTTYATVLPTVVDATVEYTLTVDNSGCKVSDKALVHFAPTPQFTSTPLNSTICEGTEAKIYIEVSVPGSWSLKYSENNEFKNIAFPKQKDSLMMILNATSTYVFSEITDANGCLNSINDIEVIYVEPLQVADAGIDQLLTKQYSTKLAAVPALMGKSGEWRVIGSSNAVLENSKIENSKVSALVVGKNIFEWVITSNLCAASKDTIEITVDQYTTYNGFSPNGDNINDHFIIEGVSEFNENEFLVFDAKGKVVYKQLNYDNLWTGLDLNGTPLPSGTYYFIFSTPNSEPIKQYLVIRR